MDRCKYISNLKLRFSLGLDLITESINSQLQSQIITMKADDLEYSVSDLSRALLRQFLSQKGLKKTLETFEKEDLRNKKKINKNLLIEMLSLKSLFLLNKNSRDSKTSLLQILVSYLNKKYQVKKNTFATTQPNVSYPKLSDTQQAKKIQVPYKSKERPSSSKPFKSYEIQSSKQIGAPLRQKQELKVIYQKLSKKQEGKEFRIVQSNALKKGEPSKIEQKPAHLEQQLSHQPSKNKVLQIEDQYNEDFQQPLPKVAEPQTKRQVNSNEKTTNIEEKNNYLQNAKVNEILQQQKPHTPINQILLKKKQNDVRIQSNKVIPKQQNIKLNKQTQPKPKDTIKQLKPVQTITKSNSQQYINPTPILHVQSQHLQLQKKQIKNTMGSSASITKEQEQKIQIIKQQPPQKPRTEMRLIGKKKEASQKRLEISQTNKEQTNEVVKEQPKKQVEKIKQQKTNQLLKQEVPPKKQIQDMKKTQINASVAAPVMVTVGKKRKQKQQSNEASYPTKFKFDQNFTHQIPKQLTYQYKQYHFEPITLAQNVSQLHPDMIFSSTINYKQKGGGIAPIKKKLQKTIPAKEAQRLKKVVFQSSPAVLPKSWVQGFILSPHQQTPYGLKQIQGGPCGIIAALQCYFLKHLMYCSGQNQFNDDNMRQVCLVAAIANMLWKVKSSDKFYLAFPPKGASKVEISNLRTLIIDVNDFSTAFSAIWSVRDEYIGNSNHGVAALLYSVVLTKGIDLIESQMDVKQNPLIGNHGHCTQQFVNLLLTGKASSNCFDGEKILDDFKLKGIPNKSQFGFLTIFQTLKYIQVGKNLKNPIFPAWVICKEFHYHVIFAPHYLISQCNKAQKIDIIYFDGLYNCGDRIRITLESLKQEQEENLKLKDLPLIEQVLMTKWGHRVANWNGSTKIL